jgi:hypothetical protein
MQWGTDCTTVLESVHDHNAALLQDEHPKPRMRSHVAGAAKELSRYGGKQQVAR